MKCKDCEVKLPDDLPHPTEVCFDCLIGVNKND